MDTSVSVSVGVGVGGGGGGGVCATATMMTMTMTMTSQTTPTPTISTIYSLILHNLVVFICPRQDIEGLILHSGLLLGGKKRGEPTTCIEGHKLRPTSKRGGPTIIRLH